MEQWLDIRPRVLREGVSKRQILRETGMHWTTLEKILEHPSPPGYRRSKRPEKPKIDPYVDRIREILAQDQHIAKIVGPRLREPTAGFLQLVSHYLFRYHFCLVARANEKGGVKGLVRYARQNFLVPVPQVRDFEELNAYLLTMCRDDLRRRLRGRTRIKEQLLGEEQVSFLGLPFTPFEACRIQPAHVNRELLVRFDDNDYSVPMEYAYQEVTVKGRTARVKICRLHDVIAVHPRGWGKEQQFFDPLHYLPLRERKPHSLAFAKPFEGWRLPRCFEVRRDRMEVELENGTREYIQVRRRLETRSVPDLTAAVEKALRPRVHTKDGLAQFLPDGPLWRQTTFDLAGRPHLRLVQVSTADLRAYACLLGTGGEA